MTLILCKTFAWVERGGGGGGGGKGWGERLCSRYDLLAVRRR